ncbi:hypothetical protein FSP39_009573 [Pinctada imbricata]|uniref:TIR domain-containing protein n=1 Tax=Pinctada imbricata TaxID=66713 RepID=A0AA88YLV5_PINIB|nr:hypothetical protein FSP39_009573 [Pinctada imbricata]
MSRLEYLDLSGSYEEIGSSVLTPGIFKALTSLKYLNLKNNHPNQESYPEAFSDLSSIETLLLNGKPKGFGSLFIKLKKLKKLNISGYRGHCDLGYIPTDYFCNISHVSILDISDCGLKNLERGTFSYITSLRDLNVSKNEELSFSILRNLTSDLIFTKIEKLRINNIHCTFGLGTEILRHDIRDLQKTSLQELHIDSNRLEIFETGVLMLMPKSLRLITIVDNRLIFSCLQILQVSDNLLGFSLATDTEGLSFTNLHNLTNFDLSSNKIQVLPELIFKNLKSIETLQLSENLLYSFDSRIQQMENLMLLNLSHNQLSELSPKLTSQLDVISKRRDRTEIKVDLTGNPLQCNCENLEFLRWKTKTSVNVTFDVCKTKYGKAKFKDLADVLLRLETECKSYTSIIVLGCCMIVVALTVIVCAIIYRFRWKLRYLYYMTKSHYFGYTRVRHDDDEEEDNIYDFDAFISYADEDRGFGLHEMLKNVEEAGNLRICCHNRDFIPGVDIAENITRAIHSSRRTICVMSPNYLNSYWCRFELNMARMESIYSRKGEEILFLVLYKGIEQCEIPSFVIDLIDKKSYTEFPDDPQGNVVFWNNIRRTISMQI